MNVKLFLILLFSALQLTLVGQPSDFSLTHRLDKKETKVEEGNGTVCASIAPCPYGTVYFEYDDRGNLIREFDDNLLMKRIEKLYEYNSQDRVIRESIGEYSDDDVFTPIEEERNTYNSQDKLEATEVLRFVNGNYVEERKMLFEYNSAGDRKRTTFLFNYNQATNQWEEGSRTDILFDGNLNQIGTLSERITPYTLQWTNERKSEWIFDQNNFKVESITYKWNANSDEWEKEGRYLFNNDSTGNVTQQIRFIWDSTINNWAYFGREVFVYNTDGQVLSREYFSYINPSWVKSNISIQNWDTFGNLATSQLLSTWSNTENRYLEGIRTDYQYEGDGFLNSLTKYEMGLQTNYQFKATERFNWYKEDDDAELISPFRRKYLTATKEVPDIDGNLVVLYTTTYHYSPYFERSVIDDQSVWTFPNPATEYLGFSLADQVSSDVSIFDVMGRLMSIQPLEGNRISVLELTPGVYFYRLEHDGKQLCGKFVKA